MFTRDGAASEATSRGSANIFNRRDALKASTAAAALFVSTSLRAAEHHGTIVGGEVSFDHGWLFSLGDTPAAAQMSFADQHWRHVDLPHDWSLEDRPDAPKDTGGWVPPVALWNADERPKGAKPLRPDSPLIMAQLPKATPDSAPHLVGPFDADRSPGWAVGWTVGGIGWYRKAFMIDDLSLAEQVEIRFDGVYREAEVWINGVHLGRNVNGYLGFAFDLTPHLSRDGANVVAVRVTNHGQNSRWYSGSGIYRHVWLRRTGSTRVPLFGVRVLTVSANSVRAKITVTAEVQSRAGGALAECRVIIRDASGRTVAQGMNQSVPLHGGSGTAEFALSIHSPGLWSPEAPNLYTADVQILIAGRLSDRVEQRFGIRLLSVSAKSGFRINGVGYKLRGACIHHDNGLLGSAAHDDAERRKVEILKANGFNAIRCSHNPFSPHFLDVCDELGMIVIDEAFDTWEQDKVADDYHIYFKGNWKSDIRTLVRRDRNHPSIAFWSIGNEIPEIDKSRGLELSRDLRGAILELDRSRYITNAIPPQSLNNASEAARAQLDVVGYNYVYQWIQDGHDKSSDMVAMSTETWPKDALDIWNRVEALPFYIGDFVWTAMDYIGEVGCGSSRLAAGTFKPRTGRLQLEKMRFFLWDFPAYQSGTGDIDLLGRKKPAGAYRDVIWRRSPLEMFVQRPTPPGTFEEVAEWGWFDELSSWTWPEQKDLPIIVRAYTLGDEVALSLNGREIARKSIGQEDRATAEFTIRYSPGTLETIAYRAGAVIGRRTLSTVGAPSSIHLRVEEQSASMRPGSLIHVLAEIRDAAGDPVPDAAVPISFEVEGAATLLRAGSANPRGLESFQDGLTRTFHGVALAILKKGKTRGAFAIAAETPGLPRALLTF